MKPCFTANLFLLCSLFLLAPLYAYADATSDEQVAIAAERNGDSENALLLYQSALSGFSAEQEYAAAARVAQSMMLLQIRLGKLGEALEAAGQAREMLMSDGRPEAAAQLASQLGSVLKARSEYAEAEKSYLVALEIHREQGSGYGIAGTLMSLGVLSELMGQPAGSAQYYEEAGDAFLGLGDERGLMNSYASAGQAWLNADDPDNAEDAFRQALFLCGKLDQPHSCASQQLGLSRALREMGRFLEALVSSDECLAILDVSPNPLLEARAQLERARILLAQESFAESLTAYVEAWEGFAAEQSTQEQAAMSQELIEVARLAGRSDLAQRYRQLAAELSASS